MEKELFKLFKLVKKGRNKLELKTDGKCFLCINHSVFNYTDPTPTPKQEISLLEELPFSLNELCFLLNFRIDDLWRKINLNDRSLLAIPMVKAWVCGSCKGFTVLVVKALRNSPEFDVRVTQILQSFHLEKQFQEMRLAYGSNVPDCSKNLAQQNEEKESQSDKTAAPPPAPLRVGRSRIARKPKKVKE